LLSLPCVQSWRQLTISGRRSSPSAYAFLELAAAELRKIAERAPDVETDLRHIVQQIETEIADMEQRVGEADTAQPISDS